MNKEQAAYFYSLPFSNAWKDEALLDSVRAYPVGYIGEVTAMTGETVQPLFMINKGERP